MKRLLLAFALAVLVGLAIFEGYKVGALRLAYPDRDRFSVRGIDVSRHQGTIDWRAVAADDVAFVYAKASEGGDLNDPTFAANIRGASAAGLPSGAYHFFTLCRPGADQARNFIDSLAGQRLALPEAIDLEFVGNCAARPERAVFVRELRRFLSEVEAATGRRPVFYVTAAFHDRYLAEGFDGYRLWVRDVVGALNAPGPAVLWQYADNGRVAGVVGPVDLDVYLGDGAAFAAFAGR